MPSTGYHRRRTLLSLCLLLAMTANAAADWRPALPDARLVGSGEFTWFGLRLYSARLWSPVTPPDLQQPFALELIYHRSLSRDTLVEASLEEMRRLGDKTLDAATLDRWTEAMNGAFVDVRPGMRITGLYLPGRGCRFYVDGELRREVDDAAFARAFFAIWLDPRARDPQLRQRLLGQADRGE
ncbi:chalcone isomerase family protein [Pseudomonas sp. 5P_5.1_Bac1]|uniref:chalcone isomerase family protein n=1 Tax=Pseudomonas sp. 5P_5.1_Bac1 TaxID=2971616 RepID=UPI0021C9EC92|nr:chalcone isomerase family protein [Pseudomonas sp. 5P_5.1_Bac1]MCU1725095.1 chalcone isomerase family protein [Pseudomonas sp. 5P_5.1_Bac1]